MKVKQLDDKKTVGRAPKSESPGSLAGSVNDLDFGQQLSSFTELKEGKRSGTLFSSGPNSPLKTDQTSS